MGSIRNRQVRRVHLRWKSNADIGSNDEYRYGVRRDGQSGGGHIGTVRKGFVDGATSIERPILDNRWQGSGYSPCTYSL